MIDDGGPIYPGTINYGFIRGTGKEIHHTKHFPGMSIVDFWAGMIAAGYVNLEEHGRNDAKLVAQMAYTFADALVAEKRKREET